MRYDHTVKYNGKWYAPGEEITEEVEKSTFSDDFMRPVYTKTEINRMPTAELQDLAKTQGVADAGEKTGAELKKILIDIFC